MGTKDKLIDRFRKQPKDFTFDEVVKLFSGFGYSVHNKGAYLVRVSSSKMTRRIST